jgi:hypothetical protein
MLWCPACEQGGFFDEWGGIQPDRDSLTAHVHYVHHQVPRWPGEAPQQAVDRLLRVVPEAATCQVCVELGRPWTARQV